MNRKERPVMIGACRILNRRLPAKDVVHESKQDRFWRRCLLRQVWKAWWRLIEVLPENTRKLNRKERAVMIECWENALKRRLRYLHCQQRAEESATWPDAEDALAYSRLSVIQANEMVKSFGGDAYNDHDLAAYVGGGTED